MKIIVKKGKTSKLLNVFISDSSSTTGAGLTGLVYNTASLTAYYYREGAGTGATAISLVTMTLGTWVSGGFVEIDATNMPGWYELGVPDAVLATGVDSAGIHLKGATNMAPLPIEIQLDDNTAKDIYDIVNHASYGNAKLVRSTTPANTLDITANGNAGIDWGNIDNPTAAVDLSATDIQLCDTTTTNTDMKGTNGANTVVPDNTSIAAILVDTSELQGDWKNGGRLDLLLDRLITEIDTPTGEPGQEAPGVSLKRGKKIDFMYKAFRNRSTQTSSEQKIYADDGTTVDQKAAISDDGTTYDKGEFGTGP